MAMTSVVGIRIDEITHDRLRFVAASKGLEPARFARLAIDRGIAAALAEMAAEVTAKPIPRVGRPRTRTKEPPQP